MNIQNVLRDAPKAGPVKATALCAADAAARERHANDLQRQAAGLVTMLRQAAGDGGQLLRMSSDIVMVNYLFGLTLCAEDLMKSTHARLVGNGAIEVERRLLSLCAFLAFASEQWADAAGPLAESQESFDAYMGACLDQAEAVQRLLLGEATMAAESAVLAVPAR